MFNKHFPPFSRRYTHNKSWGRPFLRENLPLLTLLQNA